MFHTRLTHASDYIKYLCLAIGLSIVGNAHCGALKKFYEKKHPIEIPWQNSYGYIPGGNPFNGIIENEKGEKFIIVDQSQTEHIIVDSEGQQHKVIHNSFGSYSITEKDGTKSPVQNIGEVVVIIFSTSWCPNCPGTAQSLGRLKDHLEKYNVKNVKIIYLNVGEEPIDEVRNYLRNYRTSLEVFHSVPSYYMGDLRGVPAVLVFNKQGKNVCGYLGAGRDYCSDEFAKFIIELAR